MRVGILGLATARGEMLHETTRLMEEITDFGHEPVFVNYRRTAASIDASGRVLYQYDAEGRGMSPVELDAVIPRIGNHIEAGRYALRMLELQGVPSTASAAAVSLAKDKIETQMVLDSGGVATPYGISPLGKLPDQTDVLLKHIEPNFRKPLVIKRATGSHGKGVILGETRKSARTVVEGMGDQRSFLIQEFIDAPEGQGHSDIRIVVLGGQVITAMMRMAESREEEREFRANLSLGANGIPYEPTPREKEVAIRAGELVGAEFFGADLIKSPRDALLNEVNINPEFGIEKITGVNVARLLVSYALLKATPVIPLQETPLASVDNQPSLGAHFA